MFKNKPFFIVFEGVEGCGKSYQSRKLKNKLNKLGFKVNLTREPGGTKSAELIRNLILKDYFIKDQVIRLAINLEYTTTNIKISNKDEIALFPPVSGG